jgi:ABC-type uncharacterized transport system substrate-binding protein
MRRYLAALACLFFVCPIAGGAAPPAPPAKAHIGILTTLPRSNPVESRLWAAFTDALRRQGWTEGQNLSVTYRASGGVDARYPLLAAELLAQHPDLIVAFGPAAVKAAAQQTKTVPIVMFGVPEPVKLGFIASLAHPGGNITGISPATEDVFAKGMQLLTQMRPGIRRIVYLGYGAPRYWQGTVELATATARRLGVTVKLIPLTKAADFDPALAIVAKERPDALIVSGVPLFIPEIAKIAAFAIEHRLPTMAFAPPMVRGGLLMAYHADSADEIGELAMVVDQLLRGAKPADIPVEEPNKFDLMINLRTAKAIGLAVPPELRFRADELIQ